jgi:predicted cupin superfamily sugar epimerase
VDFDTERHHIRGRAMTELPDWARPLDLAPNPEGGWFKQMWRSDVTVSQSALPPDYTGPRSAATSILLLLLPGQQSAWHTVRSAELWLYHRGSPLLLDIGAERASATTQVLGNDILAGQRPQVLVPPRHWQRARPRDDEPSLVSCVVVPGFDYADFGLGAAD